MRKQIRLGVASVDPHGDPEGAVGSPEALACHASLVLLVKQAADLLEKHYPGWGWLLGPDEAGGVINIQAMLLSGSWGYTLKIKDLQCDPQLRKVLKVGGELIERFGFKAGPFDRDTYQNGPRHLGLPVADISDLKPHERRSYRTQTIKQAVEQGRARILTDSNIAAARSARGT